MCICSTLQESNDVPDEVLFDVFYYIRYGYPASHTIWLYLAQQIRDYSTLVKLSRVCKQWNAVAESPELWKNVLEELPATTMDYDATDNRNYKAVGTMMMMVMVMVQ